MNFDINFKHIRENSKSKHTILTYHPKVSYKYIYSLEKKNIHKINWSMESSSYKNT